MLSIGALAVGKEHYYSNLARADYYTASGEPPGEWRAGSASSELGLVGKVSAHELGLLMRGLAPDGDTRLVRNAGSPKRRAGFDLTFSAPKSVSVLWALSDAVTRKAIEQAQRAAVNAALAYLDDEACFSRRGAGGLTQVRAKLVVATFEHCTARAQMNKSPDPHLHTHSLVMNVALGEDGRWGTLDGRHIYRYKMTVGVLYRAELFKQLQLSLGLGVSRRDRFCEIDGLPDAVLRAFSKRRAAIAVASAAAVQATRKTKTEVVRHELLEEWKRQALALGFDVEQVPRHEHSLDSESAIRQALPKVSLRYHGNTTRTSQSVT